MSEEELLKALNEYTKLTEQDQIEILNFESGLEQGKFEKEMELAPERINLRNENLKLRNNWNELKKWLEEEKGQYGKDNRCWYESVLEKMQELEGNNECI